MKVAVISTKLVMILFIFSSLMFTSIRLRRLGIITLRSYLSSYIYPTSGDDITGGGRE